MSFSFSNKNVNRARNKSIIRYEKTEPLILYCFHLEGSKWFICYEADFDSYRVYTEPRKPSDSNSKKYLNED